MKIGKDSLSNKLYYEIRNKIINGEYYPRFELIESDLAKEFNVSRTPIREALRKLEQDLLVVVSPHKGAEVIELTLSDMIEILLLREILEGLAARLATKRATDDDLIELDKIFPKIEGVIEETRYKEMYDAGNRLHKFILDKCQSKTLIKIVETLMHQFGIITISNANIPGRHVKAYGEHLKILNAMKNRDAEAAEQAMKEHIQNVLHSTIESYKNNF